MSHNIHEFQARMYVHKETRLSVLVSVECGLVVVTVIIASHRLSNVISVSQLLRRCFVYTFCL